MKQIVYVIQDNDRLWIDIGYVSNAVPATHEEALRIADDYRTWDCRWEEQAVRLAAAAARHEGLKYKVTCRSGKWSYFTLIQTNG